jgi:hypothetical protein
MENIKLKTGWETLYNSNFPPQVSLDNPEVTQTVTGAASVGTTGVVNTTGSSGNFLLKLMVVGGLIYLVYYLTNNYYRMNKKENGSIFD